MTKAWVPVSFVGLLLTMSGCGGSSESSSGETVKASTLSEYVATLPDGSPMVVQMMDGLNGRFSGSFIVAAETGKYAYQCGSFMGALTGNNVSGTCVASDGTEFNLTGTLNGAARTGGASLELTRSDLPGTSLKFAPLKQTAASETRADTSFLLTTGGTNGRVTVNTSPASVTTSGSTTISEHKGTWQGVPVIFWAYSTGTANLTIYIDPMCVSSQSFPNYRLSDFSTKTITAGVGQMTMYSSVTRTQIKYKVTPTVSP